MTPTGREIDPWPAPGPPHKGKGEVIWTIQMVSFSLLWGNFSLFYRGGKTFVRLQ
jgi:hypothetical protein